MNLLKNKSTNFISLLNKQLKNAGLTSKIGGKKLGKESKTRIDLIEAITKKQVN